MAAGTPEEMAALENCYRRIRAIEEQAHLQEHCYEAGGWTSISKCFDAVETQIHEKLIHFVINRINDLGGRVTPGYAFQPEVYEIQQVDMAFGAMASRLAELLADYATLCNVAELNDSYVTEKMAWKHQKWVEHKMLKFRGKVAKVAAVGGVRAYLQEKL